MGFQMVPNWKKYLSCTLKYKLTSKHGEMRATATKLFVEVELTLSGLRKICYYNSAWRTVHLFDCSDGLLVDHCHSWFWSWLSVHFDNYSGELLEALLEWMDEKLICSRCPLWWCDWEDVDLISLHLINKLMSTAFGLYSNLFNVSDHCQTLPSFCIEMNLLSDFLQCF